MTTNERNALAELAKNLEFIKLHYTKAKLGYVWADTAQRIVAELAKCWRPKAESELVNDYVAAFENIRAIAEEGAENGK